MSGFLEGQLALVTGASRGIGAATAEAMAKYINADSLAFTSIDGLYRALGDNRNVQSPQRCDACFTGDYPTRLTDLTEKKAEESGLALVASR